MENETNKLNNEILFLIKGNLRHNLIQLNRENIQWIKNLTKKKNTCLIKNGNNFTCIALTSLKYFKPIFQEKKISINF